MAALARNIAALESPVADNIPWSHQVSDSVISTKDGAYLSVWKLAGRSNEGVALEDLFRWTGDLGQMLRGIGSESLGLVAHTLRSRVTTFQEGEYEQTFCRNLAARYNGSFVNSRAMVNELYLTLVFRPVVDKVAQFFANAERISLAERKDRQDAALKKMEEFNLAVGSAMREYGPKLLKIYDHNGVAFSEPAEFAARLINKHPARVPVTRERFSEYLAHNRVVFATHGEIAEIRPPSGEPDRCGMLEFFDYGDSTEPGQLNGLLHSDFEFVLTQTFNIHSKSAAKGFLQRHQKNLEDSRDASVSQIEEISLMLDRLVSGDFLMGEHHATLLVYGKTAKEVREHLASARADLTDVGLVPRVVDLALEAGFWAQIPGNWRFRPRPATITSLNFLSFSPFHNFMTGKADKNPWGPAVTLFKTTSGTPYHFNFHSTPIEQDSFGQRVLGNTAMVGQSGQGKTVLLTFLMAQAQKLKPTIVAFDKDRGMEVAIRAMGGCYQALKNGSPTGFNPFQLEPTPENLMFLKSLLVQLAGAGGAKVTHKDEDEINHALETTMLHMARPTRRLSTLLQSLPDPVVVDGDHPSVAARLRKWAGQGELAWVFDNAADVLDLTTHQLYGFDVTQFLDNPVTRGPVMTYLVYRTQAMLDGRRFIYVYDEFWKMLKDPHFADLTLNTQKTIRKANGLNVFASQEPGDLMESAVAKTIMQQCSTFIFLPNPRADRDEYKEAFKLTDAEFDLIENDLPEGSRRFMIKQGGNSVIAELNLRGFDDELLVMSGTPDRAELLESIMAEVGDDPETWLPIYCARAKDVN